MIDGETHQTHIAVRNISPAGADIEIISGRIRASRAKAPNIRAGVLQVSQRPTGTDGVDRDILDFLVNSVKVLPRSIDGKGNGIRTAGLAIRRDVAAAVIGPGRAGNVGQRSVRAANGKSRDRIHPRIGCVKILTGRINDIEGAGSAGGTVVGDGNLEGRPRQRSKRAGSFIDRESIDVALLITTLIGDVKIFPAGVNH